MGLGSQDQSSEQFGTPVSPCWCDFSGFGQAQKQTFLGSSENLPCGHFNKSGGYTISKFWSLDPKVCMYFNIY